MRPLPRPARLLLLAPLALLAPVVALGCAAKPPADAPKSAARPALCAPPKALAPGARVPLPPAPLAFAGFTPDGAIRMIEPRPDGDPARVAIVDARTGAIVRERRLDPNAIWASTDGTIELIATDKGWVRLDHGRGTRTAIPVPGGGDPIGRAGHGPALSEDGRWFVASQDIVDVDLGDVDHGNVAHVLPAVSAGGPDQSAWFVGASPYVEACMRSCLLFDPRGQPRELDRDRGLDVGSHFTLAAAAGAVLVMPHRPFAMDWDPSFHVCRFGAEPRCGPAFALTVPDPQDEHADTYDRHDFAGALCDDGALSAVAFQGVLHIVDGRSGAELTRAPLPGDLAQGDPPEVAYAPGRDAIALVRDHALLWMEPTF